MTVPSEGSDGPKRTMRSFKPRWRDGCRSCGERRSPVARTCSCSAPPVQSASSPSRPQRSSVQDGSLRPVVVPPGSRVPMRRYYIGGATSLDNAKRIIEQHSGWMTRAISSRSSRRHSTAAVRVMSSTHSGASLEQPPFSLPYRGRRSSTSVSRRVRRPLFLRRPCVSRAWRFLASRPTPSRSTCSRSNTAFLVNLAIAGEIRLDVEQLPLDSITDAWRRQVEGAGAKLVLVP
jgi:hypothetical protein